MGRRCGLFQEGPVATAVLVAKKKKKPKKKGYVKNNHLIDRN